MDARSPSSKEHSPTLSKDEVDELLFNYQEQIEVLKKELQLLKSEQQANLTATGFMQSLIPDLIKQAIIVTDMNGLVVYWNKHASTLYGWSKEEVLGRNVMEFISSDLTYAEGMAIMELLQTGQSWSGEYLVQDKEGHRFKVHVHDSPFYDEDGNIAGIIGVSRDISEEVQTKELIRLQSNLLNDIEQAVFATDLKGNVFYWNNQAEKLFGWTREEVNGKPMPINSSINTAFAAIQKEVMQTLSAGEGWSGELSFYNKQQELIHVFSNYSPIKDQEGYLTGIIAVSSNITDLKKARHEKEYDRLNQEALINSTTDFIWSVKADYTLIIANTAFVQRLRPYVGRELQSGDQLLDETIFPPDYLHFWKEQYDKGLRGETVHVEILVPAIKGKPERWLETTINPIFNSAKQTIGIACYGKDITEAKQASQIIRQSEDRFRTMFEEAPLGIALIDSYTGAIHSVNKKFASITGRSMEELKTIDWMTITHPDDVKEDLDNMQLLNEKKIPGFTMQKRYITPEGSIVWIQMSIVPIEQPENENPRHLCMIEDITEQKKADLRLNELNQTLEKRAQELEKSNAELEQFAYVASHDLQEPLRMISSFLQLLEKNYKHRIDETADKFIHFAVDGAERMRRLIQDLLEYSRTGRCIDETGNTDMNEVVKEVIAIYQPEIQTRNAVIEVEQLPVIPETRKVQMLQLMQNIIGNALKYNESESPRIEIKSRVSETEIQISIKDNGLGIDPKYNEKVFMIFQRLHSQDQFSGTGIGLAICKKIVELYGGKISVQSELHKGSTFILTFPKKQKPIF